MISRQKIRTCCFALLVASTGATIITAPAETLKQIIVKCSPGDLSRIQSQLGAAIVNSGHGYYLLSVPSAVTAGQIEAVGPTGSIRASDNSALVIGRRNLATSSTSTTGAGTSLGPLVKYYGTLARLGYTTQAATTKIRLQDALSVATHAGGGMRIAIIDTGVDDSHPTLKNVILSGKNYVGRTTSAVEWDDPVVYQWMSTLNQSAFSFLDQSAFSFLDQSAFSFLDQSAFSFLDQSAFSFLDQSAFSFLDTLNRPPAFGHGTMMAGLVHLVAPKAGIIPLKAFDASGAATEWNIVQALYDAIDLRADVVNMSFSTTTRSKSIQAAIHDAAAAGLILVAAQGNDNTDQPTYPAMFDDTVAVSSLDASDQKAFFSNYGPWVSVSVIGTNLISTYPGGLWAKGSGTSDSVPLVVGVMALVKADSTTGTLVRQKVQSSTDVLSVDPQYQFKLGTGRLNAYNSVR